MIYHSYGHSLYAITVLIERFIIHHMLLRIVWLGSRMSELALI